MKLIFKNIILLFLFSNAPGLKAQIFPPDFQCIANDTLFWQLPVNPCGSFTNYQIFFSSNANGPYQLLATISDQNQTQFFHSNPLGETFHYYMVSDFDCPGETALSSDTLNNLLPEIAPISSVSVLGNTTQVNWQASASPEVSSYIIYRTTPMGVLPIDTVPASSTTYIDPGSNPLLKSESYYVIARDDCGNVSVFDFPHFTIHLEEEVIPCERTILLNWNLYQNWLNGIERQELWFSVNGASPSLLTSLSEKDTAFVFEGTNDGDEYCFYIKAIEAQSGEVSLSNIRCITADIVEPVRNLFLKNVSVNAANQVEATWIWNDDAEVNTTNISGYFENDDMITTESFVPVFPLSIETNRLLTNYDPTIDKLFFSLETIDDCDSSIVSNTASTIFLSGAALEDLTNRISWTAFDMEGGTVISYDVYRILDGVESFVETIGAGTHIYTDPVDISNPDEANVCYFVIAEAMVALPSGGEERIFSRSNTICVEQLSNILSPNAFAPNGLNQEFRPVIVFGETVDYYMAIFDRWGQKIFESRAQDQGWTGQNGHFEFPAGVYTFYIRIKQSNERIVEDKGVVVLLR